MEKFQKSMSVFCMVCIILAALTPSFAATTNDIVTAPLRHQYTLDFSLDTDRKVLSGNEAILVSNNSGWDWDKLCFRDYATVATLANRESYLNETGAEIFVGPSSSSSQYSNILDLETGKELSYVRDDHDPSIIYILLDVPIKSGESRNIKFFYEAQLFSGRGNLCWNKSDGKTNFNLGNFHPVLTCFENGAWSVSPYNKNGEYFYSPLSDYSVKLTAPIEYILAASSSVSATSEGFNGKTTWEFSPATLRDFAICLSDSFGVIHNVVDGITVSSYFPIGSETIGDANLNSAIHALAFFSEYFDYPYPYESFSVVETPINLTGMEFPGLIMVYNHGSASTVAHEVAHQWFYAIIGNDSGTEPWLDESFSTFSELLFLAQSNPDAYAYRIAEFNLLSYPHKLAKSVEFMGEDYIRCVYTYGAEFLFRLQDTIGATTFAQCICKYIQTYAMKEAHTEDFIKIVLNISDWDAGVLELMETYLFPHYTDMDGNPEASSVALVSAFGIFNGTSATTFTPDEPITRAMAITLLYRLVGQPPVEKSNVEFQDITPSDWFFTSVLWAAKNSITKGVGGQTFAPTRIITAFEFQLLLERLGYTADFVGYDMSAPLLRVDAATIIAKSLQQYI